LTSTAITTSARTCRIGAIGTGASRPPSTSSRPPIRCGVNSIGMAIEARMASNSGPRLIHTSRWPAMSVATAVNGSAGLRCGVRRPAPSARR
jgi:hypothetical protein